MGQKLIAPGIVRISATTFIYSAGEVTLRLLPEIAALPLRHAAVAAVHHFMEPSIPACFISNEPVIGYCQPAYSP